MSSKLGNEVALTRLYRDLRLPYAICEKLKREHGITSLALLIDRRLELVELAKKNITPDVDLLLSVIDYIQERRQMGDHGAKIRPLFSVTDNPKFSFVYFLARGVEIKRLSAQKELPKMREASVKRKLNSQSKCWVVDEDMDQWKANVIQVSDGEEPDEDSLRKKLCLDVDDDSSWTLDDKLSCVVLKKIPNMVRIPIALFKGLFPHQRQGIEWMADLHIKETGGILGDEMGMGKTRLSLAFLLCSMNSGVIRNALVVCPNTIVRTTWRKEALDLLKYFGLDCKIQVRVVTSNMPELQRTKILGKAKMCTVEKTVEEPHLVIVPYSQFQKHLPRGFFPLNREFDYVVLDEAHRVKNNKSNTTTNLRRIIGKSSRILMLTGTPLMNRIEELYRILTFATGYSVLGVWETFRASFVKPIEAARQPAATEFALQYGSRVLKELQDKIKACVLMRKRNDSLSGIVPANHEWDCWCALSVEQRELYQKCMQSEDSNMQGIAQWNHKCVFPVIGKLRMICGHPLLSSGENVVERCQDLGITKVIEMSPKLRLLVDILKQSCGDGHRVVVFSSFMNMLNIMEFVLNLTDEINVCRIDGKTSATPRRLEAIVNDFNCDFSMFNVMLVSVKAGGEGLNLTGASKCIVYEPLWSQAESNQAVARISRPGQKRECESIHLLAAGTIEEKMFGKQIYKGLMGRTVLGENTTNNSISVTDARLYSSDELSHLFELEPHGVCKTIERLELPDECQRIKKCSIPEKHPSIVGLTCRSDVYNSRKSKASATENDQQYEIHDGGMVNKQVVANTETSQDEIGSSGDTNTTQQVPAEPDKSDELGERVLKRRKASTDDMVLATEAAGAAAENDVLDRVQVTTDVGKTTSKVGATDHTSTDPDAPTTTEETVFNNGFDMNDAVSNILDVEEINHHVAI